MTRLWMFILFQVAEVRVNLSLVRRGCRTMALTSPGLGFHNYKNNQRISLTWECLAPLRFNLGLESTRNDHIQRPLNS